MKRIFTIGVQGNRKNCNSYFLTVRGIGLFVRRILNDTVSSQLWNI